MQLSMIIFINKTYLNVSISIIDLTKYIFSTNNRRISGGSQDKSTGKMIQDFCVQYLLQLGYLIIML